MKGHYNYGTKNNVSKGLLCWHLLTSLGLLSHYLPTLSQLRQRLPFGLAEEGTSLCQSETEEDGEHFLFRCVGLDDIAVRDCSLDVIICMSGENMPRSNVQANVYEM